MTQAEIGEFDSSVAGTAARADRASGTGPREVAR